VSENHLQNESNNKENEVYVEHQCSVQSGVGPIPTSISGHLTKQDAALFSNSVHCKPPSEKYLEQLLNLKPQQMIKSGLNDPDRPESTEGYISNSVGQTPQKHTLYQMKQR